MATTPRATTSPLQTVTAAFERRGQEIITHEGNWKKGTVCYHRTNCPGPNHTNGDGSPSLDYWEVIDDEGRATVRFRCHSGHCDRYDILRALNLKNAQVPGAPTQQYNKHPIITLFDLADYLLIDPRVLGNLGWQDGIATFHTKEGRRYNERGVIIPYYHEDGTEFEQAKIRLAMEKTDDKKSPRFKWTEGDSEPGPVAYGLPFLNRAREKGYIVIAEGESDFATLHLYGIPALGIPGTSNVEKALTPGLLDGIDCVYAVQEKTDQAGKNFPYDVKKRLLDIGYTGEIRRLPLKNLTGAKDPNELHKRFHQQLHKEKGLPVQFKDLRDRFMPAFQGAIDQALLMDSDTGEQIPALPTTEIDKAIENQDVKALSENIHLLAQLPMVDYLPYESQIKTTFQGKINMNTFSSAIAKERKALTQRPAVNGEAEYEQTASGMVYYLKGEAVPISNFTAEIVSDITTDDGAEQSRSYELRAELGRRHFTFELPAKEFTKCDWIDERLGARARITTGQSMKSHLVNAIKYCSEPDEQFHYAHTGWRKIDGEMVYLHNGGYISQVSQEPDVKISNLTNKMENPESAIQADGERERERVSQVSQLSQVYMRVCVKLSGPLAKYHLPLPDEQNIAHAVRRSLCFLDLTEDTITMPLYSSLWRSVLPDINYGVHLAGQSGQGKTEVVALLQQHFGPEMNAVHLPGSWESTENSLEMLLFQAKDTIVVIDDFKPKGGKVDQDRLHAKADRIFRQLGNGASRGRLNSNLEQRAERRPRCLLISTGEDIPRGQSLKARGVVLTMTNSITSGESSKRLLDAQKDARAGLCAQAMAGYLAWLAPHIETIQQQIPDLLAGEREALSIAGHARAGTNTANMLLGMKFFLRFACECGAISTDEAQSYYSRCLAALKLVAENASRENQQEKPSEQWRRLVQAALANKSAYLATPSGDCPGIEYGWIKSVRSVEIDGQYNTEETHRGGGSQIGWIDGDDLYLLPVPTYKVARAMGNAAGDDITTLETTLRKFLVQDKMLASTDLSKARGTITIRRRLENVQRDVLHLKVGCLFPDTPPVDLPDTVASVDFIPSKQASEASSWVSQVLDSKGHESSSESDSYVDSPATKGRSVGEDHATTPVERAFRAQKTTVENSRGASDPLFRNFRASIEQSGKDVMEWNVPGSGYEGVETISRRTYIARILACWMSGDERRVQAAEQEMRKVTKRA